MSKSEKFTNEEDGGTGFLIEPPKGTAPNGFSRSGHLIRLSNLGSGRIIDVKEDEALMIPEHNSWRSRHEESRLQKSYVDKAAAQLSRFSNLVAVRGSSRYNGHSETGGRYDRLDGGESLGKPDWAHHLLDRPNSSDKKGREVSQEEFTMVRCRSSYPNLVYHMSQFSVGLFVW